jgi:hypothetical protein
MGGALARHTVANGLRLAARSARAARALAASRMQAWSAGSAAGAHSLTTFVTTPAAGAPSERRQSRSRPLRVHAAAGAVPAQPFQHPQQRRVSGEVSAGQDLNARHGVGARGLGWRLIVPGLGAGTVFRFEVSGRSRCWHGSSFCRGAAVTGAGVSGVCHSCEVARQRVSADDQRKRGQVAEREAGRRRRRDVAGPAHQRGHEAEGRVRALVGWSPAYAISGDRLADARIRLRSRGFRRLLGTRGVVAFYAGTGELVRIGSNEPSVAVLDQA